MRIISVHKEKNNNIIYSTILLQFFSNNYSPILLLFAILESTPERNRVHAESKQRWLRWLRSGVLSKMAEDGKVSS